MVSPSVDGEGAVLTDSAHTLAGLLDVDAAAYLARDDASGKPGEVVSIPVLPRSATALREVVLVGTGSQSADDCRMSGAAVGRRLRDHRHAAVGPLASAGSEAQRAFLEAAMLARYEPAKPGTSDGARARSRIDLLGDWDDTATARAATSARAVHLARDLVNTPPNVKSPQWLADQAARQARSHGLSVTVLTQRQLQEQGFGGVLAVGSGSVRPPVLVQLTYQPPARTKATRHVVLVGKGITFDSGGLSLKPNDAMKMMKTDMAGSAAVLAAMTTLAELDVGARVTGLLPLAENMPSGSAMRPADVLRMYDGTTVEVLNTDAEGRLVLADAMGYATTKLQPDVLVDIATLTGAASLGLGRRHGALFTTSDDLARAFQAAGSGSGERVWRMPLVDDYRDALDSQIADIAHVPPSAKVGGGAITAALFLQRFAGGVPWVHLDVAGPARADADEREVTRGGTGYGTRLLMRWLEAGAPGC